MVGNDTNFRPKRAIYYLEGALTEVTRNIADISGSPCTCIRQMC